MLYPLVLGGVSIIASIIGTFFVQVKAGGKIMNALYKGVIVSAVLAAIAFWFITHNLFPHGLMMRRRHAAISVMQHLLLRGDRPGADRR